MREAFKELELIQEHDGIIEVWRFPYHLTEKWEGEWWTNRYCIGSDVSEGLGQNYSVAYVYDRLLQEFVVRMRSNRVDAAQWAKLLYRLSQYYANGDEYTAPLKMQLQPCLICVERNGPGQTTVRELANMGANQYLKIIEGKVGEPVTKQYGWHETEESKHILAGDLKTYFRNTKGRI